MSANTLTVDIITPVKKYSFEGVSAFFAPGKIGKFEVLPQHAAMVSEIEVGIIKIKNNSGEQKIAVSSGYCEINANVIKVLAESAEKNEEIDIQRAEAAKKRAEDRLKLKESDINTTRAEFALKRAINRIKIKN